MTATRGRAPASPYGPWFNYVTRRDQPALRLICVGGAGSGPSEFIQWPKRLPELAEVWPVQLPGRERRVREAPSSDLPAIVTELKSALDAAEAGQHEPLVLFGHSFGALIMFELARRLTSEDPARVGGLVISGLGAPLRAVRPLALSHLGDAELLEWTTGELGGTPAELLGDERFKNWLLQDLRAAEKIREDYTVGTLNPLACPILVFGGAGDAETTEADLDAWASFTTGRFRRHLLPGGHFFLRQERDKILELLSQELSDIGTSTPMTPGS